MILNRFNHRKSYFQTDPGSSPGDLSRDLVNGTWGYLFVVSRTLPFKPHLGRPILITVEFLYSSLLF